MTIAQSLYKPISKLGEGGMAEVFKAIKIGPDGFQKPVAIKRILPFLADQKAFIQMLSEEARIHAQLDHPNLVQVIDFLNQEENYFLVLEFIPGRNLRQTVKHAQERNYPLPWQASIHIACEVLKGLDFAHKKEGPKGSLHIVHRDVSPQNILLSFEGLVKLSDFGIARASINREKTAIGVLKGKHLYLSPEQISNHLELDGRSDLFALGIVLYELLCGQHPFDCGHEFQTLKKIENGEFLSSSKLRPDVPQAIHDAISKVLAKNREHRYSTASDFRKALLLDQDPDWLTNGPEKMKNWMDYIYPKSTQTLETPIVPTPIFPKNDLSLNSSISLLPRKAYLQERKLNPRTRLLFYTLSFFLLGGIGFAFFKTGLFKKTFPFKTNRPTLANLQSKPLSLKSPLSSKASSPKKKLPRASYGFLSFRGPANSEVFINGRQIGYLPLNKLKLKSGEYLVMIAPKHQKNSMTRVKVLSGKISQVHWTSQTLN